MVQHRSFCLEYLMEAFVLVLSYHHLLPLISWNKRGSEKSHVAAPFPNLPKCRGSKEEKSPSCLLKILPEFGYAITSYCQG